MVTADTPTPSDQQYGVEEFISGFFGPGNDAGKHPETVRPFIELLRAKPGGPITLPRYIQEHDWFAMYVVAGRGTNTTHVRDLIQAFAGPTYCTTGDNVPATLDPNDPVEAAVIAFAGPGAAFVVGAGTNKQHRKKLRETLYLMQRVTVTGPRRGWYVPKPLGRLLAEFQAALAAGGEAVSEAVLHEIEVRGGITATNLAHLRVKRLARLGRGRDLLAMKDLSHVLRQDPPLPVKQAVLNAVHSVYLCEFLENEDFEAALDTLRDAALPAPLPLHENVRTYGNEEATVLLAAAIGREDRPAVQGMASVLTDTGRLEELPEVVGREIRRLLEQQMPLPQADEKSDSHRTDYGTESATSASPSADTWLTLLPLAARRDPEALHAIRDEKWQNWPFPTESDEEISQLLDTLDDASWKNVWENASGPFIEAAGYEHSAPRTTLSFIIYALSFNRLGPGDLLAIQALTEIFLRSAPSPRDYQEVLDLVRDSCKQWVAPENAVIALDFADRLVLSACPDRASRTNLALALLEPLNRLQGRLETPVLKFAIQLSEELETSLEWHIPDSSQGDGDSLADLPPLSLLLYSLDESVLQRTQQKLRTLSPNLKIDVSHDKVGNDSLRHKSRNADLVVLATRCAKHAATGFITESAKSAQMAYADGSGSASLLRAAVDGLSSISQEKRDM